MSNQSLPSHASVVVLGGGIMGCSTLYHLAELGVGDAILLERNQLTSGTTWHSAAQVRALRSTLNLTNLIKYSTSLYAKLEEETGQSTGWINRGSLSIATNAERMTHIARQEALAKLFGVRANAISPDEAKERWPLMNTNDVVGAVWSPDDGRVSPSDVCAALIKGAKANGARVFENTGVTKILTEAGRIVGVDTTQGEVRCDAIALCAGLWSREVGALAGAAVPLAACEHFYLLTRPIEGIEGHLPTLSDHDGHLYIRDESGGLLVGCFEPEAKHIEAGELGDDFAFQLLPEDWDHFEPMMRNALHRLPVLETAQVRTLLNGPESFTPDGAFLLGETAETQGLFLGCGMNSVGLASGGGAGMALAHNIVHGHTPVDLYEVDPKRFPDCFNHVGALAARIPEVLGKHYEITFPGRQWLTARSLRETPLHSEWVAADAYFGQAFGFERPLYFGAKGLPTLTFGRPDWFDQVGTEVACAHSEAAVFDQSTLGKIDVFGADAALFLNRVCANQMDRAVGRAIYTTMLNERGGIESDLTAIRLSQTHFRLFVGTSAIRRDLAWLSRHVGEARVTLDDVTAQFATLALVGPRAAQILNDVGAGELNELSFFAAGDSTLRGVKVQAVRLSFVGESGFELTCLGQDAGTVYAALDESGARPAGAFAQSSMRIEKRFLAYGHDMDSGTLPSVAGLEFAVDMTKDFIGAEALRTSKAAPPAVRTVSITFEDQNAVPLGGEPVYYNGTAIGKTTSAGFGYRIGRPVAIAVLDAATDGMEVSVDIARTLHTGRVCDGAAFDPSGSRMRNKAP
jgi:glycine cleavage system aminomethyltransferase T/glycine/D-amino acid oxidase-like deaminating enzyme